MALVPECLGPMAPNSRFLQKPKRGKDICVLPPLLYSGMIFCSIILYRILLSEIINLAALYFSLLSLLRTPYFL